MDERSRNSHAYDVQVDICHLAAPIVRWARFGFWRGLSGVRAELLPAGKLRLPSAAFEIKALASLDSSGQLSEEERERRLKYIRQVKEGLQDVQVSAFERHYRNTIAGHIVDILIGIVFAVLITALISRHGYDHPLTLSLLSLIGGKIIFLFFSVRRLIKESKSTFQADSVAFELPWERD